MEITKIRKSDLDSLRKLFLKERQNTFSWIDATNFRLEDFNKETKDEEIFVALHNDIAIGFISIWLADNFIHHLYVDQKYQNQGIGNQLLKAAITQTNFPVTLKCLEKNTKAVAFYRQKGFVEKERGTSENGDFILFEIRENLK